MADPMHKKVWNFVLMGAFLALIISCAPQKETEKLTSYVNPFMGTDGPGNTYPGATVPFGMVQLSPDIGKHGWDRIAGYFYPDTIITGFSHTHLSGTGAGDLYDILVTPVNSLVVERIPENGFRPYSRFSHDNEHAEPGYYQVFLQDFGINAELSATKRTGIHRYTFPADDNSGLIIDLSYALNWDAPVKTHLKVLDEKRWLDIGTLQAGLLIREFTLLPISQNPLSEKSCFWTTSLWKARRLPA
jgi:putative alpha-1,2-mannosidase